MIGLPGAAVLKGLEFVRDSILEAEELVFLVLTTGDLGGELVTGGDLGLAGSWLWFWVMSEGFGMVRLL